MTAFDTRRTEGARGASGGEPTGEVRLEDVHVSFGDVDVLDGVTLSVPDHGRAGIVGASGAGKSTLLSVVAGLAEHDSGVVAVGGETDPRARLQRCALMPQKDLLLPWLSALDNSCIALQNLGVRRSEARRRAHPLFERFGLARFEDSRPAQLSGGMRQRVAFLRTLLAGKDVLLLDEPFGALDSITRAQMQEWLRGALREEPRTVLFVTHDVEEALLLCDVVVVLSSRPGRVVTRLDVGVDTGGPRRDVVTAPEFVALREEALEALRC
ncbi:MAG TPA: ABC transporter ATP-binding protein [Actinomycetota bacterium]|nr:ABC transporter ATP-binding protein [Actinomycetota bacterium]